jgi:hypothetical protein
VNFVHRNPFSTCIPRDLSDFAFPNLPKKITTAKLELRLTASCDRAQGQQSMNGRIAAPRLSMPTDVSVLSLLLILCLIELASAQTNLW